jgi:hypothetical protein
MDVRHFIYILAHQLSRSQKEFGEHHFHQIYNANIIKFFKNTKRPE